ncbi:MAG: hypothetical protein M1814_001684 [Vezdaea aestivalis]|nr:MAG: hypothetical protein M1814_001684 [Vezdaea aestivalis]
MLPSFRAIRRPNRTPFSRRRRTSTSESQSEKDSVTPDTQLPPEHNKTPVLTKTNLRQATRTRKGLLIFSSLLCLVSTVFLILTELGNTHIRPVLTSTYFLRIDLADLVPRTTPNSRLINSIARTLGLHDFYQVGLWNYCAGYKIDGIVTCSTPKQLYWFNPVDIILSELLAGATIALPAEIISILRIVRIASHWMFGLFITGIVLLALELLVAWTSLYSRWAALPNAILASLAALTTTAATIIATVMFIIFRTVFKNAPDLNIRANVGLQMFAFMWIGAACATVAWIIQMSMCCCCTSRRDVKTGRKKPLKNEK